MAGEVARRDRGQPGVDSLDRPDHRPREDEPQQQREDDRPDGDTDEEIPRARIRSRVLLDQVVGLRRRGVDEHRGELEEIRREPLLPVTEWLLVLGRYSAPGRLDQLAVHRGELFTLRADPAKTSSVLGRRHEAEPVYAGRELDPHQRIRDHPVDSYSAGDWVDSGTALEEVGSRILGEEETNMRGVALELAVREGSFLERAERRDPVVRQAEDA